MHFRVIFHPQCRPLGSDRGQTPSIQPPRLGQQVWQALVRLLEVIQRLTDAIPEKRVNECLKDLLLTAGVGKEAMFLCCW